GLGAAWGRPRRRPPAPGQAEQGMAMIVAGGQDAVLGKGLVQAAARLPKEAKLNAETLVLLAALADLHGMAGEAETFFRRAIAEATPDNEVLAYGGLLQVLWKANKYAQIVEVCRDGIA